MAKTAGNPNSPKKGSTIKVEPIKRSRDIKAIKTLLADKPLDLALFTVGINTNLRASDLLRIRISQVKGLKPGGEIVLKEKKTGKPRRINLNKGCISAIQKLLDWKKYKGTEYLFTGQRGVLKPTAVHLKVNKWTRAINLKGNYGSHSLRKTWGYHQRVIFGVGLPELMICFNHSSQKQTLDYLCVQPEEIKNIYQNEI